MNWHTLIRVLLFILVDKRHKKEDGSFEGETFHSEEGLKEFMRFLDATVNL